MKYLEFRKTLWTTRDGRQYLLRDMATTHIVNVICMKERDVEANKLTPGFYPAKMRSMRANEIARALMPIVRDMYYELAYRQLTGDESAENLALDGIVVQVVAGMIERQQHFDAVQQRRSKHVRINVVPLENPERLLGQEIHLKIQNELRNLEQVQPKEKVNNMQHRHLISILQKDYYTVGVKFPESTSIYTYKVPNTVKLENGEHVIVKARGDFKVVKVVRIDADPNIDLDSNYAYTWIVQKVDASAYEAQIEKEAEIQKELNKVEHAHQRATLVEKMKAHLPEGSEARQMFDSVAQRAERLTFGEAEKITDAQ